MNIESLHPTLALVALVFAVAGADTACRRTRRSARWGALKQIGYTSRVGVETTNPDALASDGPRSVAFLRGSWKTLR